LKRNYGFRKRKFILKNMNVDSIDVLKEDLPFFLVSSKNLFFIKQILLSFPINKFGNCLGLFFVLEKKSNLFIYLEFF
jgi:hypothetical protein